MDFWKWFSNGLKEIEMGVTEESGVEVDGGFHQYIGEQTRYGRCVAYWNKARKEIQADAQLRRELLYWETSIRNLMPFEPLPIQ